MKYIYNSAKGGLYVSAYSFLVPILGMVLLLLSKPIRGQNYYEGDSLNYYNMDTTNALPSPPDYSWIQQLESQAFYASLKGEVIEVPPYPKETYHEGSFTIPLVQLRNIQIHNIISEMIYATRKGHFSDSSDSASHGITVHISIKMGDNEYPETEQDFPQMKIKIYSNAHISGPFVNKRQVDTLFAFYLDSILCVTNCEKKIMDVLGNYFTDTFKLTGKIINVHCYDRSYIIFPWKMDKAINSGQYRDIYLDRYGLISSYYWKNQTWMDMHPYQTDRLRERFPIKARQ